MVGYIGRRNHTISEERTKVHVTLSVDTATFYGRLASSNGMQTGTLVKNALEYLRLKQDSAFFKKMIEDITD